MPIDFAQYVSITSAVGGAASATARELILRLITSNVLIPTGTVVEFESIGEVAAYFGTTSEEFLEAQFYFGFISKLATTPSKISFTRWAEVDVAPTVFGAAGTYVLGTFTDGPITDGAITVTMGPDIEVLTGIDFTGDTSLADVATTIQAAIAAAPPATPVWTGATVTYNATESRFEFLGGAVGPFVMSIEAGGSGTEVAPLIGWELPTARFSDGVAAETVTEMLIASSQLSNNYGSFAFIPTQSEAEVLEAATWNDGENVKYIYLDKVLAVDAQTRFDAIGGLSGTWIGLYDGALLPVEYPWLLPGAIMAATPYQRRNSVQSYMYQVATLTPTVTDTTLSIFYNSISVNYYGQTQQAGNNISFLQRGFLTGLVTDPLDAGVYANEVFLKDSIGVAIINLLLAVSMVPANETGKAQVLTAIQSSIDAGLKNGSIQVGATLNAVQKAFVDAITGDPQAFQLIQSNGYWISAEISEPTPNNFQVDYILIYKKNDVIRKVEGSHLLI